MLYAKRLSLGLLALALIVTGCTQQGSTKKDTPSNTEGEKHVHGAGPNGGVMFDLGKYHAEFTVDHPKKQCTILMIGDDEKTPVAVAAKEFTLTTKESKTEEGKVVPSMTIKMLPTDEKDGKASTFVGTDPVLINVADFEGTVIGQIDGKPSEGSFKE